MLIYYESGRNTFINEPIMNSHSKITEVNKPLCVCTYSFTTALLPQSVPSCLQSTINDQMNIVCVVSPQDLSLFGLSSILLGTIILAGSCFRMYLLKTY